MQSLIWFHYCGSFIPSDVFKAAWSEAPGPVVFFPWPPAVLRSAYSHANKSPLTFSPLYQKPSGWEAKMEKMTDGAREKIWIVYFSYCSYWEQKSLLGLNLQALQEIESVFVAFLKSVTHWTLLAEIPSIWTWGRRLVALAQFSAWRLDVLAKRVLGIDVRRKARCDWRFSSSRYTVRSLGDVSLYKNWGRNLMITLPGRYGGIINSEAQGQVFHMKTSLVCVSWFETQFILGFSSEKCCGWTCWPLRVFCWWLGMVRRGLGFCEGILCFGLKLYLTSS